MADQDGGAKTNSKLERPKVSGAPKGVAKKQAVAFRIAGPVQEDEIDFLSSMLMNSRLGPAKRAPTKRRDMEMRTVGVRQSKSVMENMEKQANEPVAPPAVAAAVAAAAAAPRKSASSPGELEYMDMLHNKGLPKEERLFAAEELKKLYLAQFEMNVMRIDNEIFKINKDVTDMQAGGKKRRTNKK